MLALRSCFLIMTCNRTQLTTADAHLVASPFMHFCIQAPGWGGAVRFTSRLLRRPPAQAPTQEPAQPTAQARTPSLALTPSCALPPPTGDPLPSGVLILFWGDNKAEHAPRSLSSLAESLTVVDPWRLRAHVGCGQLLTCAACRLACGPSRRGARGTPGTGLPRRTRR